MKINEINWNSEILNFAFFNSNMFFFFICGTKGGVGHADVEVRRALENTSDLAANQRSHYLSPHLAAAADRARLCRSLSDSLQCFSIMNATNRNWAETEAALQQAFCWMQCVFHSHFTRPFSTLRQ